MSHPLPNLMGSSIEKIREMVDVNTVIGDAITTPEGVTIIPVSKVKIGYAGGGSDFVTRNYPAAKDNAFGGGAGAGVTITPMADVSECSAGMAVTVTLVPSLRQMTPCSARGVATHWYFLMPP